MYRLKSSYLWLIGAAMAFALFASPSKAQAQNLDIHVSITATKSLSVNTTFYDFGGLPASSAAVSASSITVTNNSSVLIETYTIQGANAVSQSGGVDWTLAASTSTDQFALAAQFSNSTPANTTAAFTSDDMTSSPVTCSATVFGDGTVGESGSAVDPVTTPDRGLWFRLRTPSVVSDSSAHKITVVLAVL